MASRTAVFVAVVVVWSCVTLDGFVALLTNYVAFPTNGTAMVTYQPAAFFPNAFDYVSIACAFLFAMIVNEDVMGLGGIMAMASTSIALVATCYTLVDAYANWSNQLALFDGVSSNGVSSVRTASPVVPAYLPNYWNTRTAMLSISAAFMVVALGTTVFTQCGRCCNKRVNTQRLDLTRLKVNDKETQESLDSLYRETWLLSEDQETVTATTWRHPRYWVSACQPVVWDAPAVLHAIAATLSAVIMLISFANLVMSLMWPSNRYVSFGPDSTAAFSFGAALLTLPLPTEAVVFAKGSKAALGWALERGSFRHERHDGSHTMLIVVQSLIVFLSAMGTWRVVQDMITIADSVAASDCTLFDQSSYADVVANSQYFRTGITPWRVEGTAGVFSGVAAANHIFVLMLCLTTPLLLIFSLARCMTLRFATQHTKTHDFMSG